MGSIQAGDAFGYPSRVIAFERGDNSLYVKTIPNQWGVPNEPGEATIEHWVRLEGNVVKVHAKVVMFRSDKTQYDARQQEFPCAYLTGDYHNMWYYSQGAPYTNGDLTLSRIQPPATALFGDVFPTEPWMASTNDNGYGVGLYVENNLSWKRGYFGADLSGDEFSTVASYIAATNNVVLDHNLVYEWDYELIMGNLNTIRSYIYNKPRLASGPNYGSIIRATAGFMNRQRILDSPFRVNYTLIYPMRHGRESVHRSFSGKGAITRRFIYGLPSKRSAISIV